MAQTAVSDLDKAYVKYSPFFSELRKRLFFTVSVFTIFSGLGFIYYEKIVQFILAIFDLQGVNVVFTSPFQFLSLAVSCAMFLGIVAVLPLAISQTLSFIKPALKPTEYKTILFLIPVALVLFIGGFSFGVLIMKYVVVIFYKKSVELGIGNFIDVTLLLSQILTTSTLMGIAFQFPIAITVMLKLKVVKYQFFAKQRLVFYGLSLIFAAFLPPTDILSLVLLFLPLAILFELTLLLNKHVLRSHIT